MQKRIWFAHGQMFGIVFIDINVILIHVIELSSFLHYACALCILLCRISSSVISAVLIVCITCLIQFAFFCRVIRITSLKLHFVVSREQWTNLYESLKAQSELRIQRLGRDLFVSGGIKSTIYFKKLATLLS